MILSDRGVNGRQSPARPQRGSSEDGQAIAVACALSDSTALGIYAKTEAAPFQESPERPYLLWAGTNDGTGEIVPFTQRGEQFVEYKSASKIRADRYRLKSIVNKFLPGSRTCKCHRWRVPNQSLNIMHSAEFKKAFYAGLQVCSSVWLCPICAPKISERRRVELKGAIDRAKDMGLRVMLMTATVPHGLGDDLKAMLDNMMGAWRRMSTGRAGKTARKSIDLQGTIRVLEVTHGQNGWHPHFHVLLFVGAELTTSQVADVFRPLWQDACVKAGLPKPSDTHGLRVDGGERAASYASKWGMEHEMTKGHLKSTKSAKGQTPWDMLRCYEESKCERSRLLWLAYADAFKGRRQLYWSNGLKARLAVVDLSDEEIAAQQDDAASVLAELTDDQWRDVMVTRNESALLDVAERQPEAIPAFLDGVATLARLLDVKSPPLIRFPVAPKSKDVLLFGIELALPVDHELEA